jgi:hypothetical protein
MNPISLIFGGAVTAVSELGKMWLSSKQKKHEAKMAYMNRVVQGQADYNSLAQTGMAASWKDEFLVIWFTLVMSLNFWPSAQPFMKDGWIFMKASTPDWFSYCFVGIVVATFGLKGWKIFKNGGAHE